MKEYIKEMIEIRKNKIQDIEKENYDLKDGLINALKDKNNLLEINNALNLRIKELEKELHHKGRKVAKTSKKVANKR